MSSPIGISLLNSALMIGTSRSRVTAFAASSSSFLMLSMSKYEKSTDVIDRVHQESLKIGTITACSQKVLKVVTKILKMYNAILNQRRNQSDPCLYQYSCSYREIKVRTLESQ